MMLEPWETFEHAGLTCDLVQDDDPQSPDDWDTLGTFAGFHRLARDWRFFKPAHNEAEEAVERGGSALLLRYLSLVQECVAIPLWFDDYGANGARVYESDDPNGYLYVERAKLEAEGMSDDDARRALRSELREWDAYCQGLVTGYVVRDGDDVVDSCWGFYPDDEGDGFDYVRAQAREAAEHEAAERERATRAGIATKGKR